MYTDTQTIPNTKVTRNSIAALVHKDRPVNRPALYK